MSRSTHEIERDVERTRSLGETLSWRLVGSAGLILGGVGLALTARSRPAA
jgi:hypothetical protein